MGVDLRVLVDLCDRGAPPVCSLLTAFVAIALPSRWNDGDDCCRIRNCVREETQNLTVHSSLADRNIGFVNYRNGIFSHDESLDYGAQDNVAIACRVPVLPVLRSKALEHFAVNNPDGNGGTSRSGC